MQADAIAGHSSLCAWICYLYYNLKMPIELELILYYLGKKIYIFADIFLSEIDCRQQIYSHISSWGDTAMHHHHRMHSNNKTCYSSLNALLTLSYWTCPWKILFRCYYFPYDRAYISCGLTTTSRSPLAAMPVELKLFIRFFLSSSQCARAAYNFWLFVYICFFFRCTASVS